MNDKLVTACECATAQKRGSLFKSHLISESQMEKSRMNVLCLSGICHNNKRESVCSDVVCKEKRTGSVCYNSWNPNYVFCNWHWEEKWWGSLGRKMCASANCSIDSEQTMMKDDERKSASYMSVFFNCNLKSTLQSSERLTSLLPFVFFTSSDKWHH